MLLALGRTLGLAFDATIWRKAGIGIGVALAYYAGAQLGFSLRLPSSGISFLWPPTAILTAILLSIAPRSWLAANLGAFAAHALAHSADGLPASTWLVQFAANCFQATLGAGLARSLYSGPIRFSNLRSVVVFMFAVVLVAPAVASMIVANAYVSMGWSATFGSAWRARELSSVLAALTFTPLVMVALTRVRHESIGGNAPSLDTGWRVPLLSCALLVIGLMAGEYALHNDSQVPGVTPADRLAIVQLIIAVSAVPLMLLAALFEESQSDHRELEENQRRYALATRAGGVGVWEWNATGRTYVDPRLSQTLGYRPDVGHLETWWPRVHPDDRDHVRNLVEKFVAGSDPFFEIESRMLDRNGLTRWFLVRGAVTRGSDGRPDHVIGTYTDTTDRRKVVAALTESQARSRELAGRLLVVQEEERARIARNLHDNVSQGLAVLAIRLGVLERDAVSGDATQQQTLAELHGSAVALGEQIRHFSHELHPSILQRAGLPAAMTAYCNQFAVDHEIDVRFTSTLVAPEVSPAAALCAYRVCQESLHNVAKHAQALQVVVTLSSTGDALHLTVRDDGSGFDINRDIGNTGIGLSSADERLRLLRGTLVVESKPGLGTIVRATVPIGATP